MFHNQVIIQWGTFWGENNPVEKMNDQQETMPELRLTQRISSSAVIQYWTNDRSTMISRAYDISDKGISFDAGKEYAVDTPVYIQMRSPEKLNETILFKAVIKHQEKNPQRHVFKTGAEIVDFCTRKDLERLNQYVEFFKNQVQ